MDYKEKYEEALERARNIRFGNPQSVTANVVCEEIFPELKESEDERIRKWLIGVIKSNEYGSISNVGEMPCPKPNVIAWLEKQGEHKPADKVEPKFKVGDWVVRGYDNSYATNQVIKVEQIDDETFGYTLDNEAYFSGYWENSYRLWTIQDAKDGDVIVVGDEDGEGIAICVKDDTIGNNDLYCVYDRNGFIINVKISKECLLHPATKEQRDLLFQKMKEAGYEWSDKDRKLIELKKIEQENIEGTFINVDDVRENFVREVYRVLANDTTNDRANDIIYYFDSLPTIHLHTNKPLPLDYEYL